MSEAEETDHLAAVRSTSDHLARLNSLFGKLHAHAHCPMCKYHGWNLLVDSKGEPANITFTAPSYSFACGNCGFIRSHLRSYIDAAEKNHE